MKIIACEQLRIDNDWDLPRINACHISVINNEMGTLADSQYFMQTSLGTIGFKIDLLFGVFGVMAACILGLVIKKMWGNNKKLGA